MPFDFFCKTKIPEKIPSGMEEAVAILKKSSSKEECLRRAYGILASKYEGRRVETYLRLWEGLTADPEKLWKRNGFLHCTNMNYLLRVLLVRSGFFTDQDIELKWTLVYYLSPHQYVRVKINERNYVKVDLWGKFFGVAFGDYARGMVGFPKN